MNNKENTETCEDCDAKINKWASHPCPAERQKYRENKKIENLEKAEKTRRRLVEEFVFDLTQMPQNEIIKPDMTEADEVVLINWIFKREMSEE
ncbi:MAG: hypothetical protein HRU28_12170 [Rhizobiales bacterium]|nr:hypothetical protein [Hyphomicrobiales bacterium]